MLLPHQAHTTTQYAHFTSSYHVSCKAHQAHHHHPNHQPPQPPHQATSKKSIVGILGGGVKWNVCIAQWSLYVGNTSGHFANVPVH